MDKMEPRSELCMFVGYPKGTRGYYFYSHQDKKVFVSTNTTFLEDKHIEENESNSKVFLEEIAESSTPEIRTELTLFEFTFLPPLTTGFQTNEVVEDIGSNDRSPHHIQLENEGNDQEENLRQSISINQEPPQLRRSGRVIRQPSRYLLYGESFDAVSIEQEEDPITYKEAMEDVDADQWRSAMESEMRSMSTNSVWVLVDIPEGVKPIGCKWVYKRKTGIDGKMETFKARLVAKDFSQRE
ncbi:uncharacterized protein LOC142544133 [Primulina tabacum]|uniref:uncharacterized protein LOC142544133 n=1 Tax=Primulina tabacum TaxID=48773 RepID=UPI003F59B4F7